MLDKFATNLSREDTPLVLSQLSRLGVAIDKELTLMNERMSWLVISESFIFSAFTMAVGSHGKEKLLDVVAWMMPVVGLLLAVFVYPSILAAHSTANKLKAQRRDIDLIVPEGLRIDLIATKRAHFLGTVPAFGIPIVLILVWITLIVSFIVLPLNPVQS